MRRVLFPLLIVTLLAWLVVLSLLLSSCAASVLPTLDVTTMPTTLPTEAPTTAVGTVVETSPSPLVTVVGNVNIRTADGAVVGWLVKGDRVKAACNGQWCVLSDNTKFWRGCSDNNPDGLGCLEAE